MTSGKTKGETGRRINERRGAVGRRLKPGLSLEGGGKHGRSPFPVAVPDSVLPVPISREAGA
jgi:hypothetical protein